MSYFNKISKIFLFPTGIAVFLSRKTLLLLRITSFLPGNILFLPLNTPFLSGNTLFLSGITKNLYGFILKLLGNGKISAGNFFKLLRVSESVSSL